MVPTRMDDLFSSGASHQSWTVEEWLWGSQPLPHEIVEWTSPRWCADPTQVEMGLQLAKPPVFSGSSWWLGPLSSAISWSHCIDNPTPARWTAAIAPSQNIHMDHINIVPSAVPLSISYKLWFIELFTVHCPIKCHEISTCRRCPACLLGSSRQLRVISGSEPRRISPKLFLDNVFFVPAVVGFHVEFLSCE